MWWDDWSVTQVFHFNTAFEALTGHSPFPWQRRLFDEWLFRGELPSVVDIPTGLGKTAVMVIWLLARANGAQLPRRLAYVVDRRAVVDQATEFAESLRQNLMREELEPVRQGLKFSDGQRLPISTLRGRHVDNREWMADPAAPAIIVGTVDMIGSRLLFSGYGVSRRMRPYVAGLMGCDTLVILDEAHLARPFERLLRTIERERLVPGADSGNAVVGDFAGPAAGPISPPPFRMLPLSATPGGDSDSKPFRIGDEDLGNETVCARLDAAKTLTIEDLKGNEKLEEALAERAWCLASNEIGSTVARVRILIYCDWRIVAEKVEKSLRKRIKEARTTAETVLFVGGRRIYEREEAAKELKKYGFIADSDGEPSSPIFLVATAAGEVGIDLDADHMVCDLVAWERMVQRLGRVNRRGAAPARVLVIDQGLANKNSDKDKNARHEAVRKLLECLPPAETGGYQASPSALGRLQGGAGGDLIAKALTPTPLYPVLSRALVDAWSTTSLLEHTGRPEVGPWLRGWVEDEPQTMVVWRRCLPLRFESRSYAPITMRKTEVDAFFDAAPLQTEELLETETRQVVDWLKRRTRKLLKSQRESMVDDISVNETEGFGLLRQLRRNVPIAFLLNHDGKLENRLSLTDIDGLQPKELYQRLAGRWLVMDARFGGIGNGLLDDSRGELVRTIENNDWGESQGGNTPAIRVRPVRKDESTVGVWRKTFEMPYLVSLEGDAEVRLVVEKRFDAYSDEEARAVAPKAQSLDEHQEWAADKAACIADALALSEDDRAMLMAAARHHDDGKKALRWQRAFNAPQDGVSYAKTTRPPDRHILNGYRHEFGSVLDAQSRGFEGINRTDPRFELALHLIAAHHGNARPAIETKGCDSHPPTVTEREAHQIAVRFARLQRRWGPWGLAWWEALLRAADQQASRRLDESAVQNSAGRLKPVVSEAFLQSDLLATSVREKH